MALKPSPPSLSDALSVILNRRQLNQTHILGALTCVVIWIRMPQSRRRRLMHKTIIAAAATLLTSSGVCLAQPPGITREMIERALPVEGAPLAEPGPYKKKCGGVLRRPAQRRPHCDRLSSRRRRVRQCRVELAQVDVQRRQESRRHVRR